MKGLSPCYNKIVACLSERLYSFSELPLLRESLSLGEIDGVRARLFIVSLVRHFAREMCTLPSNNLEVKVHIYTCAIGYTHAHTQ